MVSAWGRGWLDQARDPSSMIDIVANGVVKN